MISHIVACHLLYHFSLWYIHTDSVWLLMVSLCVQWIDIHSKINKYLNSWRHSRFMILLGILASIPQCIILEIPDPLSKCYPIWFIPSNSGNSDKTLHYGNVVRIPYWLDLMFYMSYIYISKIVTFPIIDIGVIQRTNIECKQLAADKFSYWILLHFL